MIVSLRDKTTVQKEHSGITSANTFFSCRRGNLQKQNKEKKITSMHDTGREWM